MVTGAAAILSFVLGWAEVTYPTPEPSLTTDTVGHARLGLYLGLFMILAGLVAARAGSREVRRAWAIVGCVCGLVVGAFAVVDLLSERVRATTDLIDRTIGSGAGSQEQLRAQLSRLIQFSFRAGIYVALACGALALVAAVLILLDRGQVPDPASGPS
jgi:hypothetical protein